VNLGIQAAFASNVAAGSASSAPGRGPTGEPGAETFFSTYVLSVSTSSANSVRLPENGLTKIKSNAKAAAGIGGLTASSTSAPKEETSPTAPATSGAPVTANIPATTASLPSPTTLATLPDLSQTSSDAQGALVAEGGGPSLPRTSASQISTPQSLTPEPSTPQASAAQSSTAEQSGTATPLRDTRSDDDLAPAQSSSPGLNPAFAEPGQVGLDPGVVAATIPVQKTASANTQSSAATTSSPSAIVAPPQNGDAAPVSGTSLDEILGNVISESGTMPAAVSSAANPQSRGESLAGAQRVASGEVSDVRTPPASGTGGPTVGVTAPHGPESAASKSQNGLTADSLFQLHFSSANTSASPSSSSSSSSVPPVPAGIPVAAASAGPDSSSKQTIASAETNHSPGNVNPASGAQGKDSGSSDSAAGQSEAEQAGLEQAGPQQSGPEQSGQEQSFRKDLTAVASSPAAAQTVLPQVAATTVPGDAAGQPGTTPAASPAANAAPKPDTAATPTTPDSSSSRPAAATGESPLTPAVGPVQMAQMVSRAAQSEMRIGLTTSAFGNVEVRTQIRANDVGLVIGSERGDLRSLLANELPGLANRLQQQSLRLSQVNFHETSAFSGGSSSGGNPQRRFFTQPAPVPSPVSETSPETFPAAGNTESSRSRHAGLSVLA
jgi:flagellar hook-length control protein FliK